MSRSFGRWTEPRCRYLLLLGKVPGVCSGAGKSYRGFFALLHVPSVLGAGGGRQLGQVLKGRGRIGCRHGVPSRGGVTRVFLTNKKLLCPKEGLSFLTPGGETRISGP